MPIATARLVCLVFWLGTLVASASSAAEPRTPPVDRATTETVVVGVVESPPFAMREDGEWTGLTVELWRLTADQLGIPYRLEAIDTFEGLLDAVRAGRVDVAVGPTVITPQLQREMDFTIPYLHAGLSIAAQPPSFRGWFGAIARTFSSRVWVALAGLLLASLLFGMVMWLLERHRNPESFGGGPLKGIGEGVWWATSTMTTVGYGDRTPVTPAGRTVGIVWMLASIVLISGFTAMVTSSLTVHQLRPLIRSVHDLAHVQVGVVRGSDAAAYLERHQVDLVRYDDMVTGLEDVADGELAAFVGEGPSLRYLARTRFEKELALAPHVFDYNYLALALPNGSERRRMLNVGLLHVLQASEWEDQMRHYLGP
jgi:ABC-type amino acid transport substrate-binding protein